MLPVDTSLKQLEWSTSDEKIATVDENGVVTGVKAGTATITATTVYAGISNSVKVNVTQQPREIKINAEKAVLWMGDTITVTAQVLPEDTTDKTVTWESADETVVKVVDGIITAVGAGETTVSATSANGKVKGEITIEVRQQVTQVEIEKSDSKVNVGEALQLTAKVYPENAYDKSVKWESSDEEIATVDENGAVTAKKAGTVTIRVKTSNTSVTGTATLKVIQQAQSITLESDKQILWVGETATVTAQVLPEDTTDKTVSFESLDESVATVDEDGVVTALKAGTAKIKATSACKKASDVTELEVISR